MKTRFSFGGVVSLLVAGVGGRPVRAEDVGELATTHDYRPRANAATVQDLRWAYWRDLQSLPTPRLGDASIWRGVQLAWVRNFRPAFVGPGGVDPQYWIRCASSGVDAEGNHLCSGADADAQAALRQTATLTVLTESAPAVDYSRCRPRQMIPAPELIARDCPQCSIKPVSVLDGVSNPGVVFSNFGVNPAPAVVNPSTLAPLMSLKPAASIFPMFAGRERPAGALLAANGDVARVAYLDEGAAAVRYEAPSAAVSARVAGVPQSAVAAFSEETGRLMMPIGAAAATRAGVTMLDPATGARSFRVLTSGTLTVPEAAAVAPGTRALFVVDRRSAGERRLVRIGPSLEVEHVTSLPASGAVTLAPEVGSRLAVGWSNAGRYGAALLDVGEARVRVLASTAGAGTLDVAPRASEKGLEFVASASASAEKRRVIAPLAAAPTPLVNLDSLLRNGR